MTEKTLNNCFLLHVHKNLTDNLDLASIAKKFVHVTNEQVKYFGDFSFFLSFLFTSIWFFTKHLPPPPFQ